MTQSSKIFLERQAAKAVILHGADIIPSVTVGREWDRPNRVADSQRGRHVRNVTTQLEHLIEAHRTTILHSALPRYPEAVFAVHPDHGDEETCYECINSADGRVVWTRVHREFFRDHPEAFDFRPPGTTFVQEYAKFIGHKNEKLGSAGKPAEVTQALKKRDA